MTGEEMDDGYPRLISSGFPGMPNDLDAAFVWPHNGHYYFFKGSQYWRFEWNLNGTGQLGASSDYPQPISLWKGVPDDIDGVVAWTNGLTYFFKEDKYYRFNDTSSTVSIPINESY